MKAITPFLLAVLTTAMFSCNSQQNKNRENVKDIDKNAMLVENAKVEGEDDAGNFIKDAFTGGLKEVELGRYAEENAASPRVRNFAALMVRDHTGANDELKSIATSRSLYIPVSPSESELRRIDEIKKKTGADFDKEYIKEMVEDHKNTIDLFRHFSENGKDQDLKAFASKTLPVLINHQDSAKNINDAITKY